MFSEQGCQDTCGAAPHTQGAWEATWCSCLLPYLAGSPFRSPTLRQYTRGELQSTVLCLDSARVAGSAGPVSPCLRTPLPVEGAEVGTMRHAWCAAHLSGRALQTGSKAAVQKGLPSLPHSHITPGSLACASATALVMHRHMHRLSNCLIDACTAVRAEKESLTWQACAFFCAAAVRAHAFKRP